jgi:hypothetical protein
LRALAVFLVGLAVGVGATPGVQAAGAAQAGRWCRGGNPPLYASDRTSCPFAARVYSTYASRYAPDRSGAMRVWSPTTRTTYRESYRRSDSLVVSRGRRGTGIYVRARWVRHG